MLLENSMYKDQAGRDAITSNKALVNDLFFTNFLGFIGLYALNDSRGYMKDFEKTEKKLMIADIGDDNHDVSLIIKLAVDADLLTTAKTIPLTKFLALVKQRRIRSSDIDSAKIREMIEDTQMAVKPMDGVVKTVVKGFMDGTYDVKEFARQIYDVAKKPAMRDYTLEFRTLVIKGQYTDYFTAMKRSVAANGHSAITAQGAKTTAGAAPAAVAASQPAQVQTPANTPAAIQTPAAAASQPAAPAVQAPARRTLQPSDVQSARAFAAFIKETGINEADLARELRAIPAPNPFYADPPSRADAIGAYSRFGEAMIFNKAVDGFVKSGNWGGFAVIGISPTAAALSISRVAAAAKDTKLSPSNRKEAIIVYNIVASATTGWAQMSTNVTTNSKIPADLLAAAADRMKKTGFASIREFTDLGARYKENDTALWREVVVAIAASTTKWSYTGVRPTSFYALPWYVDQLGAYWRDNLNAMDAMGTSYAPYNFYTPPAGAPELGGSSDFPQASISWMKDRSAMSGANRAAVMAMLNWMKLTTPNQSTTWKQYLVVAGIVKKYAKFVDVKAEIAGAMSAADPKKADHKIWLLTLSDEPQIFSAANTSNEAYDWLMKMGIAYHAETSPYASLTETASKFQMEMSRKPTMKEISAMPTTALVKFMAENFSTDGIAALSGARISQVALEKLNKWDPISDPVTPLHVSKEDAEFINANVDGKDYSILWRTFLARMMFAAATANPDQTATLSSYLDKHAKDLFGLYLATSFNNMRRKLDHWSGWANAVNSMPIDTADGVAKFFAIGNCMSKSHVGYNIKLDITKDADEIKWILFYPFAASLGINIRNDVVSVGDKLALPSKEVHDFIQSYGLMAANKVTVAVLTTDPVDWADGICENVLGVVNARQPDDGVEEASKALPIHTWREAFARAVEKHGLKGFRTGNVMRSWSGYDNHITGMWQALANDIGVDNIDVLKSIVPNDKFIEAANLDVPLTATGKAAITKGLVSTYYVNEWLDGVGGALRDWAIEAADTEFGWGVLKDAVRWLVETNTSVFIETIEKLKATGWANWRYVLIAANSPKITGGQSYDNLLRTAWDWDNIPDANKASVKEHINRSISSYDPVAKIGSGFVEEILGLTKGTLNKFYTGHMYGNTFTVTAPIFLVNEYLDFDYMATLNGPNSRDPMQLFNTIRYQDPESPEAVAFAKKMFTHLAENTDRLSFTDSTLTSRGDSLVRFAAAVDDKDAVKKVLDNYAAKTIAFVSTAKADEIDYSLTNAKESYDGLLMRQDVQKAIIARLAVSTSKTAEQALVSMAYRSRTDASSMMPSADFVAAVRAAGKERAVLNRITKIDGTAAALSQMKADPLGVPIDLTPQRAVQFFRFNDIDVTSISTKEVKKFEDMNNSISNVADVVPPLPMVELTTPEVNKDRIRQLHRSNRYNHSPALGLEVKRTFKVNIPGQKDRFDAWVAAHPNTKLMTLYHGTGTIAAQFMLRYGFRIIKSTDGSVTGRMLGDGIYFADNVNKSMLYMSNSGYIRQPNQEGYVFKCQVALGQRPRDHREGNVEKTGLVSNEWSIFNIDQIYLEEAYFGVSRTRDTLRSILAEARDAYAPRESTFIFMDGLIPTSSGEPVVFEDFVKTMPSHVTVESTAVGPMVIIRHDTSFEEMQGCYRYWTDAKMSGEIDAFLALVSNTY